MGYFDDGNMPIAIEIVGDILHKLKDRQGFDYWWNSIDEDIQSEIVQNLRELVVNIINK